MRVRISLVEENPELRATFVTLLNRAPGLHCVGSYGDAGEALLEILLERPDVVLLDSHLHGMSGIEFLTRLKTRLPGLRVLMLARYEHSDAGFDSLCAGASGYLLKHAPAPELIEAIGHVHAGGAQMTMPIARKVIEYLRKNGKSKAAELTLPEREIIELIAGGYLCHEIADVLGINPSAVRTHLQSVCAKLQTKSRPRPRALLAFSGRANA